MVLRTPRQPQVHNHEELNRVLRLVFLPFRRAALPVLAFSGFGRSGRGSNFRFCVLGARFLESLRRFKRDRMLPRLLRNLRRNRLGLRVWPRRRATLVRAVLLVQDLILHELLAASRRRLQF